MQIRTLRGDEHEALLDLLDGWELPDGWRGHDFFRRCLEDEPGFRDENVWVAEAGGRLVSCVQIFPRRLRVGKAAIPAGGIGSVFTGPDARGSGVASALLERAAQAMRERGMPLSLLFASRLGFYGRLGWVSWPGSRTLLRPVPEAAGGRDDAAQGARPFEAERDLAAVQQIHEIYTGSRQGTAIRNAADWRASLRIGGNPLEQFLVALRDGQAVAYARATVLSGFLVFTELGRVAGAAAPLALLMRSLLTPCAADPLARPGRPSAELRKLGVAPPLFDAELETELRACGVTLDAYPDPNAMLRVLDAPALAEAAGTRVAPGEDDAALLRRILPPERFCYWAADRF